MPATTYSPTQLPGQYHGAGGLNFRVRNGNGCGPTAIATDKKRTCSTIVFFDVECEHNSNECDVVRSSTIISPCKRPSLTGISTGQLNTSPCLHLQPINLVVFQGPSVTRRSREILSWDGLRA